MSELPEFMWAGVALAALLALWLAWAAAVSWHYRVRHPPPAVLRARALDGWELAVHHRPSKARRYLEPVVLCHGFAANRYTFELDPPYSLAVALSQAGFDCYTPELRGTGASSRAPRGRAPWDYSIDDHVELDAPAIVNLALERSGASRAFWVAHSLGGLIGYAAAQGPVRGKLAGLAAIGSPLACGTDPFLRGVVHVGALAAWPFGLRQRLLSLTLAPFLGYVTLPLSDVIVNPQHIPPPLQRKVYARMISRMGRHVLEQLDDWFRRDVFQSRDGRVDWRAGLKSLDVPLLVMGGSRDKLAPPAALKLQYELAGSLDKTLLVFGRDRGDALDYGHGDLLFGAGAPKEVYPLLREWLEKRATPLSGAGGVPGAANAARPA